MTEISPITVSRLRVNLKSLASESKIIRREMDRLRESVHKNELHNHRVGRVRVEARYAGLALAFLRGKPYKVTENSVKEGNKPSSAVLFNKLHRFAPGVTLTDVKAWLDAE